MTANNSILPFDSDNREMCYAYDLISKTNKSFFLTGKAGTGKTTFLKKVQESVSKNFIVLAPSGVAAIHAGGQTIHSFFGFDLGVQGPRSYGNMNTERIALVQNVDTIIIDEVSMVRCDIMDAVDRMLRHCRHSCLPFGGVQMVLVGDIFQLPPVVTKEDYMTLHRIYGSECFLFHKARCIENNPLPKIEFQRIYRQADRRFIEILDHFRVGEVSPRDLEEINRHASPVNAEHDSDEMRITLTSFRKDAKIISAELSIGEAVNEYERKGDYDGAAATLFSMCDIEAHNGNVFYAYDLMSRAMSYLADDTCLFGRNWQVIPNDSKESVLLNAAGLLYSGRTDEAISLLTSILSASGCNFNGLYLLARALELKKDWETVETLYNQMIEVYRTTIDNGLDSAAFRKLKYRLAVLNESHYGDPGVEVIVNLIAENPSYDRYYAGLRWMIQKHRSELNPAPEQANPLMSALMDQNVSEGEFLSAIQKERCDKSEAWKAFCQYIGQLKTAPL